MLVSVFVQRGADRMESREMEQIVVERFGLADHLGKRDCMNSSVSKTKNDAGFAADQRVDGLRA